jgi:hypothetical protein
MRYLFLYHTIQAKASFFNKMFHSSRISTRITSEYALVSVPEHRTDVIHEDTAQMRGADPSVPGEYGTFGPCGR